MKRKLALLLVSAMVVGTLAGCGTKKSEGDAADAQDGTDNTAESTETLADLDTSKYITLGEYKGLSIDVGYVPVTDEQVVTYTNDYLVANYSNSTALTADDTVQTGDTVHITCVGTVDGVVFEGGSTAEGEEWDQEIGAGNTIDGYEDGFIGMKVGETKDIHATFPDPYSNNPDLAGKEAVFTVTVNSAERTTYATELTDEVLAYYGYATADECYADVKSYLEETALSDYQSSLESAIVEAVYNNSTFTGVPQFLVDLFTASQTEYYTYYATQYGLDLDTFIVSGLGTTKEEFDAKINEIATSYAEQYVMYEAIADLEGFNPTQEELDAEAEKTAASYGYESIDALYEDFGTDDFRDYVVIQKVIDFLVQNVVNTNTSIPPVVEETAADTVTE